MSEQIEIKLPLVAVDVILENEGNILMAERKNSPKGWALPGGFVELGEDPLEAARRELCEETRIKGTDLKFFNAYGCPSRDPRTHVVSLVYQCTPYTLATLRAASDALSVAFYHPDELPEDVVFDHRQIIEDYVNHKEYQQKLNKELDRMEYLEDRDAWLNHLEGYGIDNASAYEEASRSWDWENNEPKEEV